MRTFKEDRKEAGRKFGFTPYLQNALRLAVEPKSQPGYSAFVTGLEAADISEALAFSEPYQVSFLCCFCFNIGNESLCASEHLVEWHSNSPANVMFPRIIRTGLWARTVAAQTKASFRVG